MRVRLFAGAPDARTLDWNDSGLCDDLIPAFRQHDALSCATTFGSSEDVTTEVKWRSIPLVANQTAMRPSPIKESRSNKGLPNFASPEEEDDFIEQSIAFLDGIQSSQIGPDAPGEESTIDNDSTMLTSFADVTGEDSTLLTSTPSPLTRRNVPMVLLPYTAIKSIPAASHLLRIRPQTVTVNLVVGVISISPPRTVHVRKGNYDMDLIEIMVGDETKAGFTITAWLQMRAEAVAPESTRTTRSLGAQSKDVPAVRPLVDDLRTQIANLRRGDVIAISTVALTAFNGVTYGQTLHRRASGIRTQIAKLDDSSGFTSDLMAKVDRIKEWVAHFVGVKTTVPAKRKEVEIAGLTAAKVPRRTKRVIEESFLPPDSQ